MAPDWLWIVFTLAAALAQTARNSMQKELTARIGTLGATHARFLYGLPFAALFLGVVLLVTGIAPPLPEPAFLGWITLGGLAQICATGLLLAAMRTRSFVVSIAYTKIEPVLVLAVAFLALNETLAAGQIAAVIVATVGVVLMSWPPSAQSGREWYVPVAFGLASGGLFAVSAVAFRGGILTVGSGSFLVDASLTLTASLALQTALLSGYLLLADRATLLHLLRTPVQSTPAGFFGALASQFWFLAFALQTAALVRTLALAEVLFAQIVSRRLFRQTASRRERAGVAAVVAGVAGVLLMGG